MVVVFGTLGFTAEKFLAALPSVGAQVERAVVYTGREVKPREKRLSDTALAKVRSVLQAMTIACDHKEFSSPWDFAEIARSMMMDLREVDPRRAVFNLTGGPKTMTVAATVACLVHGVRVLYVPEELEGPSVPVELPLLRIRYSQVLSETQQKVLRVVRDHSPRSLDELAQILRKSNSVVTVHAQKLAALGALSFLPNPDNRLLKAPRMTVAGEIMLAAEEALSIRSPNEAGARAWSRG